MATAETVELGEAHFPKEESLKTFADIEHELKRTLVHERHSYNKHEPEYFAAVSHLSDEQLTNFSAENFELVRIGESAYGLHLFGKLRLPELENGYIHFRAFVSGDGPKFNCIHTEETEAADGDRHYRAIFKKDDVLEWFTT